MSGLQFGLNVKSKKGLGGSGLSRPSSKPVGAKPRASVFADEDDDDEDADQGGFMQTGSKKRAPTAAAAASPLSSSEHSINSSNKNKASSSAAVNRTLQAYATSTRESLLVLEQQNAALAEDASVFEYDGVYDSLKAGERLQAMVRKQEAARGESKYIASMLQSREQRQQDQQIAQEKKLERERQAEGEMYADKDQFVTPAYKAQKEAARQAEEEERRREEELAKDKDGKRMQGFYRHMLDEQSRLRPGGGGGTSGLLEKEQETMLAEKLGIKSAQEGIKLAAEMSSELNRDKTEEEKAQIEKARAEGLRVVVNDDGQVVDKRDLLKSGLNVFKKPEVPSARTSSSSASDRNRDRRDYRDRRSGGGSGSYKDSRSYSTHGGRDRPSSREASNPQRSRMTEQIERQLLEQEKQREQEEKERQDSIREALKRKNQDDQVMDAKARYLARKKAAAEAAAAAAAAGATP